MAEIYESQINDEKGKLIAYKKFTSASWVIVDQKRVIECLIYYIKNREMYQATASCTNTKSGILPDTDIPDAPTFTDTATILEANNTNGVIVSGDLGGKTDIIIEGTTWPSYFTLTSLAGSSGTPYRFRNQNVSTILGTNLGNHSLRTSGTCDYIYIYGLSPAAPLLVGKIGDASGDPGSGVAFSGSAAGNNFILQNFVIFNVGFAGVVFNSTGVLSGGDVNTPPVSTVNYASVQIYYIRIFSDPDEGEPFYIGNTGKSAYAIHHVVRITNCMGTNKGRDALQLNNVTDAIVTKCTFYDCGKTNTGSQNNLIQVQNSKAVISKCIFDTAPGLCDISTIDLVVENCYFRWTTDIDNLIHDYVTGGDYADGDRLLITPVQILFNNCIFDPSVNVAEIFRVYERTCNVEVRNSIISTRVTAVFQDSRGASPTNSLIGGLTTNGNTHVAPGSIERPAYTNMDQDQYLTHGRNTNLYIKLRGMGFRNPY